ncbi:MAG: hypothetical protein IJW13_01435 [Clostridia bacterium]|nr:hypothetical protein [Clostridia bacterium]
MLKVEFEQYLIKQGYSVITPSGNPSTVYDYIKRIDKVIEWEHLYSWDELAKNISKYVSQYGIGGIKQAYGQKSHAAVINALLAFQRFLNSVNQGGFNH